MAHVNKLECEVKRLTKVRDTMDAIFCAFCISLIIIAAIVCPIMVKF